MFAGVWLPRAHVQLRHDWRKIHIPNTHSASQAVERHAVWLLLSHHLREERRMIILSFLFIIMYTSQGGKEETRRRQDVSTGRSRTQQDLRRHCCGLYIEPPSSTLTDGSEDMATLSLYRALSRWLYRFICRRRAFFVAQNFKQVGQLYPADLTWCVSMWRLRLPRYKFE